MTERPEGVVISTIFIVVTLTFSALSRVQRATELRVSGLTFANQVSAEVSPSLLGEKVNLVPLQAATSAFRARRAAEIRAHYQVTDPLAFLHVNLLDNRSEFIAPLRVQVTREGENLVIEVSGAIAIANTIAYLSELIDPTGIFLGLTGQNLMHQSPASAPGRRRDRPDSLRHPRPLLGVDWKGTPPANSLSHGCLIRPVPPTEGRLWSARWASGFSTRVPAPKPARPTARTAPSASQSSRGRQGSYMFMSSGL